MKINNINNVSFAKTLKAQGAILKEGNTSIVSIYHLDKKEDVSIFFVLKKQKDWANSFYLEDMCYFSDDYFDRGFDIYTLEDENNKTLSYALTKRSLRDVKVNLFEVAPRHSKRNEDRNVRFVGETMISFLAMNAKKNGKNLRIKDVADRKSTKDFYFSQCKFTNVGNDDAILKKKTAEKLAKANALHTGKRIELIG